MDFQRRLSQSSTSGNQSFFQIELLQVDVKTGSKQDFNSEETLGGEQSPLFELSKPLTSTRTLHIPFISSENLKEKLQNHEQNLVLIDCREPYEFKGGHIKGALSLQISELESVLFSKGRSVKSSHEFKQILLDKKSAKSCLNVKQRAKSAEIAPASSKKSLKDLMRHTFSLDGSPHPSPLDRSQRACSSQANLRRAPPPPSSRCFLKNKLSNDWFSPVSFGKSHDSVFENLFKFKAMNRNILDSLESAPSITIVLYCEFSSVRAPCVFDRVREKDRSVNRYPNLSYKDLFVLQGGYAAFVKKYEELCVSHDSKSKYVPMRGSVVSS